MYVLRESHRYDFEVTLFHPSFERGLPTSGYNAAREMQCKRSESRLLLRVKGILSITMSRQVGSKPEAISNANSILIGLLILLAR